MGSWQKTQSEMKIFAKFLLSCVAMLCVATSVSAQDIIVMNNDNADELQVKVVEVLDDVVKYKKWTYQDGPTFSISTTDIFVIKYQNGEKQRFEQSKGKKQKTSKKESKNEQKLIVQKDKKAKRVEEKPIETSNKSKVEKQSEDNGKVETVAMVESTPKQVATTVSSFEKSEDESWINKKKGTSMGAVDLLYYAIPDGDYDSSLFLGQRYCFGYNVVDNLFIQSGLGWMTGWVEAYEITDNSTSLNLPIQIGYNLSLGGTCSLDIKTGPQLNYIIAGKLESDGEEVKYKDLDYDIKRFSAEYTIGASLLFKNWGVAVEYGVGLGKNESGLLRLGIVSRF